jgi:hypothetical protein
MEARDLGIGIVMIIPAFVGAGALWHFFHSWPAILVWIIVMACVYGGVLLRRHRV